MRRSLTWFRSTTMQITHRFGSSPSGVTRTGFRNERTSLPTMYRLISILPDSQIKDIIRCSRRMSRPTLRITHSEKCRTNGHENMSRKQNRFSKRYAAALQKYLKPGLSRRLQRGIIRRKVIGSVGEKHEKYQKKCLAESLQLEKRLRHLAHRTLAAQEDERNTISHELQDEIAQTLLGINVRLLNLKVAARGRGNLTKEIASTQRLVLDSIQTIHRFANVISKRKSPVAPFVVRSACNSDETRK